MLAPYSRLKAADNSGAREVMIISAIGNTKRRQIKIGDIVIGTVKKAAPQSGVKKGEKVRAV
ncbi:uL14 family ribosomal protein, partial [Candidatus Berkelbacteria bacterium]|nr:uL14 family ribosomal protein [Candidatus Berkelbacteria bacterium]